MTTRIGTAQRGGVNSGSNTSLTVSRDASTLTGDRIIVAVNVRSSKDGPLVSPPDGTWTRVPGTNPGVASPFQANIGFPTGGTGTLANVQIFHKIATSDGAQSYTFTLGTGAVSSWTCVTLRNADAPAVLGSNTGSSSPASTAAVTTTEANEYLLRYVIASMSTSTVTSSAWDVPTKLTDVQGTGSTTSLLFAGVAEETGPSTAGAVAARSATLTGGTITGVGTVSLGFPTTGGGGTPAPVNTVVPVITTDGTPQTGEAVTADTGTWSNTPTSYAYQWKRNGSNISGATSSSYTLVSADEGTTVTVTVTATNAGGSASATSAGISPVAADAPPPPANTIAPSITTDGTPEVGETVTVNPGTWDNSPTSYTYQWLRFGAAISGATSSSYVLTSSDVGTNKLSCSVTAVNAGGSTTANTASISPAASPHSWRNLTVYRYSNGTWS